MDEEPITVLREMSHWLRGQVGTKHPIPATALMMWAARCEAALESERRIEREEARAAALERIESR